MRAVALMLNLYHYAQPALLVMTARAMPAHEERGTVFFMFIDERPRVIRGELPPVSVAEFFRHAMRRRCPMLSA